MKRRGDSPLKHQERGRCLGRNVTGCSWELATVREEGSKVYSQPNGPRGPRDKEVCLEVCVHGLQCGAPLLQPQIVPAGLRHPPTQGPPNAATSVDQAAWSGQSPEPLVDAARHSYDVLFRGSNMAWERPAAQLSARVEASRRGSQLSLGHLSALRSGPVLPPPHPPWSPRGCS